MYLPILMVDDDPNICSLVKDYLESKGYAVLTAGNGVEAMRLMMFHHPHLLICDIKMPQKNGYRLLSELRQLPEFRLLPVILLTELDDSESRIQGYEVGCDVYLPKPFDLAELLAIVRNLLERSQMIHHELQFHPRDLSSFCPDSGSGPSVNQRLSTILLPNNKRVGSTKFTGHRTI